jgi:hypothetical protein
MRLMLAAMPAELLQFQTLRRGLLILGCRIVPVLALGALERDNFSRHLPLLLIVRGGTGTRLTGIEPVTFRYGRSTPSALKLTQKLEPLTGIEPVTSSLPRTRSTI